MNIPAQPPDYRDAIDAAAAARSSLDEITAFASSADGAYARRLQQHAIYYERALRGAHERYLATLPRVTLALCPFTGEEVQVTFDPFGLDGPWWDYAAPVRVSQPLPETWFAMTGAMSLASLVEATPFLVRPGPAVPALVRTLMDREDVQAVVSSVPVGGHTGYAVSYFTHDASGLEPVDTWGASEYRIATESGEPMWCEAPYLDAVLDFDLAPWIESGRLAWIAPGDDSATLRREVEGCPYIDLTGVRVSQYVQHGVVWTPTGATRSDR